MFNAKKRTAMKYIDRQREKVIALRDNLFDDPGQGVFMGKEREFVLSNPAKNLWKDIHDEAVKYFADNKVSWWKSPNGPSGHLLSSQVACVNHLFPISQSQELATAVLKNVDPTFKKALKVDERFVEFEKVGQELLGKERTLSRGANSTSIDAMMLGEKNDGTKILVLIEWKYTENYADTSILFSKSGTSRLENYRELLEASNCPVKCDNLEALFYEPFYQLMRQTLLGSTMTERKEYGTTDWLHLHIVPPANKELKERVTSPLLSGKTMEEAWKKVLRQPEKYKVIPPEDFLSPLSENSATKELANYLDNRYWKN